MNSGIFGAAKSNTPGSPTVELLEFTRTSAPFGAVARGSLGAYLWTVPPIAKYITIECIGGGGGGGSGRRGAAGSLRSGGVGGAVGGKSVWSVHTRQLEDNRTLFVSVGAGGVGAAAPAADDTNGNPGAIGVGSSVALWSASALKYLCVSYQTTAAPGGTSGSGVTGGGAAWVSTWPGTAGGGGNATAIGGNNGTSMAAQPGAGGGGVNNSNVAFAGGGGYYNEISRGVPAGGTATGGAATGGSGANALPSYCGGAGGGGGGGGGNASGGGGAGGNGAFPGGGGGGGGGGTNGATGGAGGNGGDGVVRIYVWY